MRVRALPGALLLASVALGGCGIATAPSAPTSTPRPMVVTDPNVSGEIPPPTPTATPNTAVPQTPTTVPTPTIAAPLSTPYSAPVPPNTESTAQAQQRQQQLTDSAIATQTAERTVNLRTPTPTP